MSDRNTESLYDIQDDANVSGQDGDEKHVSWKGVHTESAEKSNGTKCFFVSRGGGGRWVMIIILNNNQ